MHITETLFWIILLIISAVVMFMISPLSKSKWAMEPLWTYQKNAPNNTSGVQPANGKQSLGSGARGTVFVGPTCAVMQTPPDPNCADKPYQGAFTITKISGGAGTENSTITSDANGRFSVSLYPGTYEITKQGYSSLPVAQTMQFTVAENRFTDLVITLDSGIR